MRRLFLPHGRRLFLPHGRQPLLPHGRRERAAFSGWSSASDGAAFSGEVWAARGSSALEAAFSGEVSGARVSTTTSVAEVKRSKKMVKIRCHGMTSKHESVLTSFFDSIYQFHLHPNNGFGIGT
jgi:hypothetical protein